MEDRCIVCTQHTIGSEIILDAPDGTLRSHGSCGMPGDVRHVESHFGPFGDSVSVSAR